MADYRAVQVQEQRDDKMIKENDKDAIIAHLTKTLQKVKVKLSDVMFESGDEGADGSSFIGSCG